MNAIVTYSGTAPGADANTYAIFSTVTAYQGKRMAQMGGARRIYVDIKHSQNGTLNLYKSVDRGTNWHQVDTVAATATGATTSDIYDADIEPYDDFKLEWVNGGAAQATWVVSIALVVDRAPAS